MGHLGEFSSPVPFCAVIILFLISKISVRFPCASAKLNSHVIHSLVGSVSSSNATADAWHLSLQMSFGILCATDVSEVSCGWDRSVWGAPVSAVTGAVSCPSAVPINVWIID